MRVFFYGEFSRHTINRTASIHEGKSHNMLNVRLGDCRHQVFIAVALPLCTCAAGAGTDIQTTASIYIRSA